MQNKCALNAISFQWSLPEALLHGNVYLDKLSNIGERKKKVFNAHTRCFSPR